MNPKLMNVADTKWAFYESMEDEDTENMANYFETLFHHYQERGRKIKALSSQKKELKEKIEGHFTKQSMEYVKIDGKNWKESALIWFGELDRLQWEINQIFEE